MEKLEYYKGNKNFPIYSKNKLLKISNIFKICLQRNVRPKQMVKKRPVRVTNAATFVLNQKEISLQHPFDLEADDVAGSYLKKEQSRYYEVTDDDNDVAISSTVHVLKDADGKVIKGTINERVATKRSMKWVKRNADLNCVYAVIRKRAVHKRTLEVHNVNFVRYITYIMPLTEYNEVHWNLRNMQNYNLQEGNIIMQYCFDSENKVLWSHRNTAMLSQLLLVTSDQPLIQ